MDNSLNFLYFHYKLVEIYMSVPISFTLLKTDTSLSKPHN